MQKSKPSPVKFLGTYVLPATLSRTDLNGSVRALVVLHLNIKGTPGAITTALIFVGKRDVQQSSHGTHPELLGLAGVSHPFQQN